MRNRSCTVSPCIHVETSAADYFATGIMLLLYEESNMSRRTRRDTECACPSAEVIVLVVAPCFRSTVRRVRGVTAISDTENEHPVRHNTPVLW